MESGMLCLPAMLHQASHHQKSHASVVTLSALLGFADRKSNMHYLIPVFATLTPQEDDVIKLHAMVEDYASALNRKDVLNVRLKAITGDDNKKVRPSHMLPLPC